MPRSALRPRARVVLVCASLVAAAACSSGSHLPAPEPPASTQPADPSSTPAPGPAPTPIPSPGADPAQAPTTTPPAPEPSPAPTQACFLPPACDAAPPSAGTAAGFDRTASKIASATGKANHRVHDLLLAPSDDQVVIATFVYDGLTSTRLEGEDVEIHLLRGCGASWELLGTARTTSKGAHATVEGVADAGGQVYFPIPASQALGAGRHRLRLVVRGDLSAAEGFIEVQPKGTSTFVADVDGTLTPSDLAEVGGVLTGTIPEARAGAAAALAQLAAAGHRPIYLTARTASELRRTREFLGARGFPPGPVRTAPGDGLIGLSGAAAASFKAGELARFQGHGVTVALGIGNSDTDAQAYQQAGVAEGFLFGTDAGQPYGAQRIDDYASLVSLASLPAHCAAP